MTVKKIALLGLASVVTLGLGAALAGGPGGCAAAAQVSGFYVGADVGATYNATIKNGKSFTKSTQPAATIGTKYSPWAWTASALVGYKINNHWAVQFGYIWNQSQKMFVSEGGVPDFSSVFKFYQLYLSLKGVVALSNKLNAYLMIGPAYVNNKYTTAIEGVTYHGSESYYSPMGAVGVSYAMDQSLSFNLQYMFIMKDVTADAPSGTVSSTTVLESVDKNIQRITLGVNYLFAA